MSNSSEDKQKLLTLEELFYDQLNFKIMSLFNLLTVQKQNRREIISFLERLKEITVENLKILTPYVENK